MPKTRFGRTSDNPMFGTGFRRQQSPKQLKSWDVMGDRPSEQHSPSASDSSAPEEVRGDDHIPADLDEMGYSMTQIDRAIAMSLEEEKKNAPTFPTIFGSDDEEEEEEGEWEAVNPVVVLSTPSTLSDTNQPIDEEQSHQIVWKVLTLRINDLSKTLEVLSRQLYVPKDDSEVHRIGVDIIKLTKLINAMKMTREHFDEDDTGAF